MLMMIYLLTHLLPPDLQMMMLQLKRTEERSARIPETN